MKPLTLESLKRIEDTVSFVEKSTSAEVVVAICPASGSYRDVDFLVGFILSFLGLGFILFSPWHFHLLLILPDSLLFFLLGIFLAPRIPALRRALTSRRRRRSQVRRAAQAAFVEEKVSATRDRNGILFFLSLFEDGVEILPDLGIDGRMPRAPWNEIRHEIEKAMRGKNPLEEILRLITKSGEVLARHFPAGVENPDEIPNRPRMRIS